MQEKTLIEREKKRKDEKIWKKCLQRGGIDDIIDEHSREGDRDIENWTVNTSIKIGKKKESRRHEIVWR